MIPLFHYTLNPGGILFLGTSESIGENRDFFHPINSKWKIFERKTGGSGGINDFTPGTDYPVAPKIDSRDKENLKFSGSIQEMAEKAILDEYAPAGVLVNDQYEIVHFVGQTEKFLVPPTGRPVFNILSMAREDLKPPLTTSLHKAVREKANVFLKGLRIRYNGSFCIADLSVKRMKPGFMLVIFEDKTPEVDPKEPETLKPKKKQKGRGTSRTGTAIDPGISAGHH